MAFANDDFEKARRVKYYWEIIADNLSKGGWSWGCVSAIDSSGRTRSGLQTRIAAPFPSFGSVDRTRIVRSNYAARRPGHLGPDRHKGRPLRPPDAQLSALALHLPTPRATG